jgi:DNA-binding transcriptional regulator YiaG
MTKPTITEPDTSTEHPGDDYATATSRVHQARERLLADPRAAAAHQTLTAEIETRLDAKQATLAEVRRAIGLTQIQMAEVLGMSQGDVSKLERRENLHLTTLCRFIEATGGRLRISATYGDTEIALQVGDLLAGSANEELLDAD